MIPINENMFSGFTIALAGTFSIPQAQLKNIIKMRGGRINTNVTQEVTHVISTYHDSTKTTSRVALALKYGKPLIDEQFIHDCLSNLCNEKDIDSYILKPDYKILDTYNYYRNGPKHRQSLASIVASEHQQLSHKSKPKQKRKAKPKGSKKQKKMSTAAALTSKKRSRSSFDMFPLSNGSANKKQKQQRNQNTLNIKKSLQKTLSGKRPVNNNIHYHQQHHTAENIDSNKMHQKSFMDSRVPSSRHYHQHPKSSQFYNNRRFHFKPSVRRQLLQKQQMSSKLNLNLDSFSNGFEYINVDSPKLRSMLSNFSAPKDFDLSALFTPNSKSKLNHFRKAQLNCSECSSKITDTTGFKTCEGCDMSICNDCSKYQDATFGQCVDCDMYCRSCKPRVCRQCNDVEGCQSCMYDCDGCAADYSFCKDCASFLTICSECGYQCCDDCKIQNKTRECLCQNSNFGNAYNDQRAPWDIPVEPLCFC